MINNDRFLLVSNMAWWLSANKYGVLVCMLVSLLFTNGCASIPGDFEKKLSYALQDTAETRIGRKLAPAVVSHPGQSGFYLLTSGIDAFTARVALIMSAERSLDMQYYIWHNDKTGMILVDHLLRAADRGVRIRLILDDFDTKGKEHGLMLLNRHPKIDIRLYNPFAYRKFRMLGFVTDFRHANRRMHNKSITVDNQLTIVGGRNIGDEYFDTSNHAQFTDLDVLAIGPVVRDASNMFDMYWNHDAVFRSMR
jgi:putative cardiolipin synthase